MTRSWLKRKRGTQRLVWGLLGGRRTYDRVEAEMGKRLKQQTWLVMGQFLGGPADGERVEFQVVGMSPVAGFVTAVETEDIPETVVHSEHHYTVSWKSLVEVKGSNGEKAGVVIYKYDGLV
jgi:hypothetical protein